MYVFIDLNMGIGRNVSWGRLLEFHLSVAPIYSVSENAQNRELHSKQRERKRICIGLGKPCVNAFRVLQSAQCGRHCSCDSVKLQSGGAEAHRRHATLKTQVDPETAHPPLRFGTKAHILRNLEGSTSIYSV